MYDQLFYLHVSSEKTESEKEVVGEFSLPFTLEGRWLVSLYKIITPITRNFFKDCSIIFEFSDEKVELELEPKMLPNIDDMVEYLNEKIKENLALPLVEFSRNAKSRRVRIEMFGIEDSYLIRLNPKLAGKLGFGYGEFTLSADSGINTSVVGQYAPDPFFLDDLTLCVTCDFIKPQPLINQKILTVFSVSNDDLLAGKMVELRDVNVSKHELTSNNLQHCHIYCRHFDGSFIYSSPEYPPVLFVLKFEKQMYGCSPELNQK